MKRLILLLFSALCWTDLAYQPLVNKTSDTNLHYSDKNCPEDNKAFNSIMPDSGIDNGLDGAVSDSIPDRFFPYQIFMAT